MASLSSKLAGVVLNAFNYGNHIGSVNGGATLIDDELGRKNFKHAGEHLCELWNRDPINRRPVVTTYVEEHDQAVFSNIREKHGIELIVIHKFANILLIFANVKIRIAVDHHELHIYTNFYH